MSKIAAPSALVLAVFGWALTLFITNTMLSGVPLAERSCQTECIRGLFFSTFSLAAITIALAVLALRPTARARIPGILALALAIPMFAIYAGIVVIGILA